MFPKNYSPMSSYSLIGNNHDFSSYSEPDPGDNYVLIKEYCN